jgi:hypothetical protein
MRTAFLLSIVAVTSSIEAAPPKIAPAEFQSLHRLMQAAPEEQKWQQIPWRTNLWQARVDAAAAGKPIYLWEMDGHPLGCT